MRVSKRKWRWRNQAIDQLLHAPEDVPEEALQLLTKCAAHLCTLPVPYDRPCLLQHRLQCCAICHVHKFCLMLHVGTLRSQGECCGNTEVHYCLLVPAVRHSAYTSTGSKAVTQSLHDQAW